MTDKTYNGWPNYATWGVALVLDNDEGSYNMVREVAEGHRTPDQDPVARFRFSEWLKDLTEELCGLEDDPGPSLMARQVLSAGLAGVDWDEIARVILSE